ncbi:hypothetical protein K474DRAFT_212627 [Panus rudis PR-1116 ss-1]|nr:hypothetical protein K474DRAFT_212627 [Panus rudis PR-1116 ss-1]
MSSKSSDNLGFFLTRPFELLLAPRVLPFFPRVLAFDPDRLDLVPLVPGQARKSQICLNSDTTKTWKHTIGIMSWFIAFKAYNASGSGTATPISSSKTLGFLEAAAIIREIWSRSESS